MIIRVIKLSAVAFCSGLLFPSCVCQVQTAHVINLHGKACEGIIIPLLKDGSAEFIHAGRKNYVKAIRTRLEPAEREVAYYQWPNAMDQVRPVPGAEQRTVYLRLPEGIPNPCAENWTETPPAGAQPGVYSATREVAQYPYIFQQYSIVEKDGKRVVSPVLLTSALEDNARSWYTKPLAATSFVVIDIPATIIGSAVGVVYTLLSPSQSFSMQVDYFGNTIYLPAADKNAER